MHYDISFPNLGIYLDHVGKNISIFGFEIAYYGIIIGCAILIGFLIATSEAKRTRQNPEDYLDMGIVGVIAGIVGPGPIMSSFPGICTRIIFSISSICGKAALLSTGE